MQNYVVVVVVVVVVAIAMQCIKPVLTGKPNSLNPSVQAIVSPLRLHTPIKPNTTFLKEQSKLVIEHFMTQIRVAIHSMLSLLSAAS